MPWSFHLILNHVTFTALWLLYTYSVTNDTPTNSMNGIALRWHTDPEILSGERFITFARVCVCNSELSAACCQLIPVITGEETKAEVKLSLWNGNDDLTLWQKLSARTREFIFLCDKAQPNLRKKKEWNRTE